MIEELQEDDWLALCLGSNDSNPIKIGVELSSLLKRQNKAKILVTSVIENPYLNAAAVWDDLPFALFAGFALLSGLLVLITPETLGSNLPDTMEEAEQLGRKNEST
ncbi:unnamed protein product [Parnassius apollo]|uniref:(apollo) hypothetical protein n=1 Tax=Parnassius apollo TaxID=110799 RepID=A0A8S3YC33_PARAO|nr:unnamed protein product [Parnassius apollo]